jgi:hypothetical protein
VYRSTHAVAAAPHPPIGAYTTLPTKRSRSASRWWKVFWYPPERESCSLSSAIPAVVHGALEVVAGLHLRVGPREEPDAGAV